MIVIPDKWEHLPFWTDGAWGRVLEHLERFQNQGVTLCPHPDDIFNSLEALNPEEVKVVLMGQDPYPNSNHATGWAFDAAGNTPPTLQNILKEYVSHTHNLIPQDGNLGKWMKEGVLLWNSILTCNEGVSLSHEGIGWEWLTKDLVEDLSPRGVIFVFLGRVARSFAPYVDTKVSRVIEASHPSPRASAKSGNPFFGSRIFTRANLCLKELGKEPIDWSLR